MYVPRKEFCIGNGGEGRREVQEGGGMCMPVCLLSRSVVSSSFRPYGLYSLPGSSVHEIFQTRILE